MLLTLSHPDIGTPIRVCSDSTEVISAGQTYQPFPFRLTLPSENEEAPQSITLEIDNVDRQIVQAVRQAGEEPTVTLSVVLASSPDMVEAGPFEFTLRNVQYNEFVVSGELAYLDILNEPYPFQRFTPNNTPGLF